MLRFARLLPALLLTLTPLPLIAAQQNPPVAPVLPITDSYFGTSVVDRYRWMERGTADPRFVPYLQAEDAFTASQLAPLAAQRNALRARLLERSAGVAHVTEWQQVAGKLFFEQLDPSASVPILRMRDTDRSSRTLFDPSTVATAGSHAAIDYYAPSLDGSHVAIGVSPGGSENDTIYVLDVTTGRVLPDTISRAEYGSPSWRQSGASFYYSRLQALPPGAPQTAVFQNQHVYLHKLGTDPQADSVVFGPGVDPATAVPVDGFNAVEAVPRMPYLIAIHSAGTTDPGFVYVRRESENAWRVVLKPSDRLATNDSGTLAVYGSKLYALLRNEPNGRVVAIDLARPEGEPATVVPASAKVIEGIYGASDGLYVEYRNGLTFEIVKADSSGVPGSGIALPFQGSVYAVDASPTEPGLRFGLDSWTHSALLLSYDPGSAGATDTGVIAEDPADVSHLVAREVSAPSSNGASVPISIITRDDVNLDGSNPTLYEGYGAYGIPIDASFSATMLEWVRRGGVLAYAHVRGGGEFGESWHVAGEKATKQHTIDDMIATARYLISARYTSPQHLAVRGTSAGGIAVGGALVQHPELFAAAVDNVGMTNILRFQQTEGGPANVPEFGDVGSAADFAYMYPLDAYERVKDGVAYPAVMCVTGLNDPRVPTWMVAKMAARLQAASASGKPIVLRADFDAGHGIGSSRTQALDERADEWTFLLWQLGDPEFQPK